MEEQKDDGAALARAGAAWSSTRMATLETTQRCEDTMGASLDESSDGDTAWRGVAEGAGSGGVQETRVDLGIA
jgi:hypothetical protein